MIRKIRRAIRSWFSNSTTMCWVNDIGRATTVENLAMFDKVLSRKLLSHIYNNGKKGEWYHIAIVSRRFGRKQKFYVNGRLIEKLVGAIG